MGRSSTLLARTPADGRACPRFMDALCSRDKPTRTPRAARARTNERKNERVSYDCIHRHHVFVFIILATRKSVLCLFLRHILDFSRRITESPLRKHFSR